MHNKLKMKTLGANFYKYVAVTENWEVNTCTVQSKQLKM